jgi:hypothetical protein
LLGVNPEAISGSISGFAYSSISVFRIRTRCRRWRWQLRRQSSKILSIHKQQIEREEHAVAPAEQQVVEHGAACVIDTGDFAIEHGALDAQMLADPLRQILEVAKGVAVAGDEIALALLDVGEGAEAVDLQLVYELIGVERFRTA